MARNVKFEIRRGAGSSLEVLYGKVSLTPTLLHTVGTSTVLPAPTTFDLINGVAIATNVAPSPAPVGGQVEWAYTFKITDNFGKTWEYMAGVPDGTTEINFNVLPRYFSTKPPLFGQGPQGVPGEAASIAIGSVGAGPTPAVTNTGTATDAILNFTLAQGPQGPPGTGFAQIAAKPASDIPTTYPMGASVFWNGTTDLGYPFIRGQVVTVRSAWDRASQTIYNTSTATGTRVLTRESEGSTSGAAGWGPFKEYAFNDLATPLMNGLMPALDKAKLDGMTPAANSKTFAALASTYQVGFSTLQVRAADGWPITTTGTVVTQKNATGNASVAQWLYAVEGGAPQYRGTDAAGNWQNFETVATESWLAGNLGFVSPEQFGAVGDGLVDDGQALQGAITASISAGVPVYLENTYYTASLGSTFWSATYEGGGGIRVGTSSTVHRPSPTSNGYSFPIYYDSNNGSDTNSGLSPDAPMATMATFVNRYTRYMGNRPGTLGAYKLVVANGVHRDKFRSLGQFPPSSTRFWIEGESREGAILDGTGTSNAIGIWVEPGAYFGVRDMTIQNFQSPDTSGDEAPDNGAGIVHKGGGDVRVQNTTIRGCSQGVGFINGTAGVLTNSLIEDCLTGVRVLYSSSALISYSTIRNCTTHGVFVSRNAVAHVDYNTIEDCVTGISVNMASRTATLGGEFLRNELGVLVSGAGEVIISEATAFTGNTRDRAYYGVGRETRIHGNSPTTNEWCLHKTSTGRFHSGTTANTTIYSPGSSVMVYPRHHTTPNSKLRVKLYGQTAGPGTKTLRFYALNPADSTQINLLASTVISAASTGEYQIDLENWGVSNAGNHGRSKLEVSGQPVTLSSGSNSADTTYKWMFRVMAQCSDSEGSVSLQVAELYLNG